MKNSERFAQQALKALASLKLAVIVIISLGVVCAWGTIVESKFNSEIAQKVVYRSPWMYLCLITLVVNLIAVMVDRLPWKKKHLPFLLAHVGIITMLLGAYLTQRQGIDGSIAMEIGEKASTVTVSETDFSVYELTEVTEYKKIHNETVDFYMNRPEKKNYVVDTSAGPIKIIGYIPFALRKTDVRPIDKGAGGPAVRYQLKNNFVSENDWIVQSGRAPAIRDFGPAQVILGDSPTTPTVPGNQIIMWPGGKDKIQYAVYTKDGKQKSGTVAKGEAIKTGWMGGLELLVLNYYPEAKYKFDYEPKKRPTENTVSALEVEFNGDKKWLGLNSALELFTSDRAFVVAYGNRRIPMGFEMKLLNFEVGRYQGTSMAMSYESLVETPEGQHKISMNEPLKYKGLTFYQSSFQEGPSGKPTASILTVNRDPGRYLKYLGSLLIVAGSIYLFYTRKIRAREA